MNVKVEGKNIIIYNTSAVRLGFAVGTSRSMRYLDRNASKGGEVGRKMIRKK